MSRMVYTPKTFNDNIIRQFTSNENIGYLSYVLDIDCTQMVMNYLPTAQDLLIDPTARNQQRTFFNEVRRLNANFITYIKSGQNRDQGGREAYHLQMFTADSLYPPGLESLNERYEPIPPFDRRREQKRSHDPALIGGQFIEFRDKSGAKASSKGAETYERDTERFVPTQMNPYMDREDAGGNIGPNTSQQCNEDDAWDVGNPYKTADDRMAEYINSDWTEVYGDRNGPRSRYYRYETIPFWQYPKTGRGLDRSKEANLCQVRGELENPIFSYGSSGYLAD